MPTPLRILNVEDSEDDALILLRLLRKGGYEPSSERVETAEAMRAALAEKPWDLVVSDYRMPSFSGMDALMVLKESGLDLPFILLSGTIGEEAAVAALKAGAHDFVKKDDPARLLPAIQRELQEAASRQARREAEAEIVRLNAELEQRVVERTTQLKEAYERLKELDRLKDDFVNAVSHELRTPLTSIMGYAEFLEDELGGPLTPQQLEFVLQIERSSRQLENLVNDLLDFARIEAGTFTLKLAPSDLGGKIKEIAESLRPQMEVGRLQLDVDLPEAPMVVRMDAQRIGQVLINLIGNAVKFTPEGGHIRVHARVDQRALRCEVADSGAGISAEDQAKLFQRFSQLESGLKRGGTGLGLSIAKALIEAHGGQIGVDSAPGQGSTFWFTLPLSPVEQQPPVEAEGPAFSPGAKKH